MTLRMFVPPSQDEIEALARLVDASEDKCEVDEEIVFKMHGHLNKAELETERCYFKVQSRSYSYRQPYIAYGKWGHFTATPQTNDTMLVTLKIGRNLSVVFSAVENEILSERQLYLKYNKVLKSYGIPWPEWVNRESGLE